jgi:hypothetical protein
METKISSSYRRCLSVSNYSHLQTTNKVNLRLEPK